MPFPKSFVCLKCDVKFKDKSFRMMYTHDRINYVICWTCGDDIVRDWIVNQAISNSQFLAGEAS